MILSRRRSDLLAARSAVPDHDPVARRLILDPGVLVAADHGVGLRALVEDDDDLVVAASTVAELQTGVELASAHGLLLAR